MPQRIAAVFLFLFCRFASAQGIDIDIPYQKFVLKNGLTVIVHEDHKAPIVAVNVWYHQLFRKRAYLGARLHALARV